MDRFLTPEQKLRLQTVNPAWMSKEQYTAEMLAIYKVMPTEVMTKTAELIWDDVKSGKKPDSDKLYNAKKYNDEQRKAEREAFEKSGGFATIAVGVDRSKIQEEEKKDHQAENYFYKAPVSSTEIQSEKTPTSGFGVYRKNSVIVSDMDLE